MISSADICYDVVPKCQQSLGQSAQLVSHRLKPIPRVRKTGSFQKSPFSRNSREFRDSREENPQTLQSKREADHLLEILENLQIPEILEIFQ